MEEVDDVATYPSTITSNNVPKVGANAPVGVLARGMRALATN